MPFNLSQDTVDALLDKLSSDDAFREQFQKDPRQALAGLGHAAARDTAVTQGVWACMNVTQLASKEAIQASRDTLRKQLLAEKSAYSPISLEVAKR